MLEVLPGIVSFSTSLCIVVFTYFFGTNVFRRIFPNSLRVEQRVSGFLVFCSISYILFLVNTVTDGFALLNSKYVVFLVIFYSIYSMISCYMKHGKLVISRKNLGLLAIIGVAVFVYSQPILLSPNGVVWLGGDMVRHIQIIRRLTLGHSRLGGLYSPQYISYPWLFHSSIAVFASFFRVFGYLQMESIFQAYNVINIITIVWGVLSINALSTVFFKRKREQLLTTFFGSLSGGLGYLFYRGGSVISDNPFGPTYGDMKINYPYNGSLALLSPAWPRHFGYVIYITSLYYLLKTIENEKNDNYHVLLSAVSLGLAGVTHPVPCIVVALALVLIFIYRLTKGEFSFTIFKISMISFLVFSPYMALKFLNFAGGGSTLLTFMKPIDIPIYQYLTAIGLVFLFSLVGFYDYILNNKNKDFLKRNKAIPFFVASFLIFIIISILNSSLNLEITVFGEPLFRQHKYWFLFYPLLSLYATIGYSFVESIFKGTSSINLVLNTIDWGKQHPGKFFIKINPYKSVFLAIVLVLGLGSPVLTSIVFGNSVSHNEDIIKTISERSDDNLLFYLSDKIDKHDVIATPANDVALTQLILTFTGAYVLYYDDVRMNYSIADLEIQDEHYHDCVDLYGDFISAEMKTEILNKYSVDYIISKEPINNIDLNNVEYFGNKEVLDKVYYLYALKTP